jgi:hypothetical protein
MRGRKRCRIHGGANPGAPVGNRNAYRHGMRSAKMIAMREGDASADRGGASHHQKLGRLMRSFALRGPYCDNWPMNQVIADLLKGRLRAGENRIWQPEQKRGNSPRAHQATLGQAKASG